MRSSSKVIKAAAVKIDRDHSLRHLTQEGRTEGSDPQSARPAAEPSPSEKAEKATAIRQEAYDLGMAEGLKRGVAQQKQEFAKLANTLSGLIAELTRERKESLDRMEKEALRLAFAIAEKILNHQIETDRDAIGHVLTGALKKCVNREGIRIHLHPDDYRYLTEVRAGAFPGLEGIKSALLEADATIRRGGAVIESAFGEVDARLEQQLSELKGALSGQ